MRPMILSTEKVNAILEGRKTSERRPIRPQPMLRDGWWKLGLVSWSEHTNLFCVVRSLPMADHALYLPGDAVYAQESAMMTQETARLFIRITELRASRLQAVMGRDVLEEGIDNGKSNPTMGERWENMQRMAFQEYWDGEYRVREDQWDANPWVWVYIFKPIGREEMEHNGR